MPTVKIRDIIEGAKIIHIEMQVIEQSDIAERISYYNAKALVSQMKSGDLYNTLQKVISIVIADFDIVKASKEYSHRFQLREEATGVRFTDIIEINTLELTKIPRLSDGSKRYEWAQFLKSEQKEEFEMLSEKNAAIGEAYARLRVLSQDEENQLLYEAREKVIRDQKSREKFLADKLAIIEEKQENVQKQQESVQKQQENVQKKEESVQKKEESVQKKEESVQKKEESVQKKEESLNKIIKEEIEKNMLETRLRYAQNLLDVLDVKTIAEKTGLTLAEVNGIKEKRDNKPKEI